MPTSMTLPTSFAGVPAQTPVVTDPLQSTMLKASNIPHVLIEPHGATYHDPAVGTQKHFDPSGQPISQLQALDNKAKLQSYADPASYQPDFYNIQSPDLVTPAQTHPAAANNSGSSNLKPTLPVSAHSANVQTPAQIAANKRLAAGDHWTSPQGQASWKQRWSGQTDRNPRRSDPPIVHRVTDCGRFQHELFQTSDPNFPAVGTATQLTYVQNHSKPNGTWQSGEIAEGGLQPGDWMGKDGHVAMYGGVETSGANKGKYIIYEASLDARKGHGHGPKKDYYTKMPHFDLWARPKH